MSLYRWSLGILLLGALLLATGIVPEAIAFLLGVRSAVTALLLLSIAPLGALLTIIGFAMLLVALVRARF